MNQNLRVNKTNFHIKGFTLGLALKQRRKATWKSPIEISAAIQFPEHIARIVVPTPSIALVKNPDSVMISSLTNSEKINFKLVSAFNMENFQAFYTLDLTSRSYIK